MTASNIRLQDRPCARCVKRSIGHLCHDEPRDSTKAIKRDQVDAPPSSGAAVKQEDSLPYTLGPAIDQQQLDQQSLEDNSANVTTGAAAQDNQTDDPEFLPRTPDNLAQGQSFGDKNQQCEKHIESCYRMAMATDRPSSWLRRLESRKSKPVLGYA